jgi:pyruvate-ferredoxin/flavodoxin oxidoreductase
MKGTMQTIDGNTAACHVAYGMSEVATIYPITPSSPLGEIADSWAVAGRKNIFDQKLSIKQMQSEAGAAGAVHGSLVGGAVTTTFTASQGLLLKIPNMYKIAGELLPCVFHVTARSLSAHALSIFGDQADVMATRQTGFAMLVSSSVQEVMDLALVAHLATMEASVPFLHFYDGFQDLVTRSRRSRVIDYRGYGQAVQLGRLLGSSRNGPSIRNVPIPGAPHRTRISISRAGKRSTSTIWPRRRLLPNACSKVSALTGRNYSLFDYIGDPQAERVIVAMGSGCEAIEETVDALVARGEKVGAVKVGSTARLMSKPLSPPFRAPPRRSRSLTGPRSQGRSASRSTPISVPLISIKGIAAKDFRRSLRPELQRVQSGNGQGGL